MTETMTEKNEVYDPMEVDYDSCPYDDELSDEELDMLFEFGGSKIVDMPLEDYDEDYEEETQTKKQEKTQSKPNYGEIITVDAAQPYYKLDFIIPGLARGDVGILAGSGGTGKSFVALELAYSVAYGTRFYDADGSKYYNPKKPKKVRVVNLEDRQESIANRLISIRNYAKTQHYGAGNWPWDRMIVHCAQEHVETLKLMDAQGNINAEVKQYMMDQCQDIDLLILDPLSQVHLGDENNNTLMSNLMGVFGSIAKATNTAILLVHHASEGAVLSGIANEQQATRGASAIVDSSRLTMTLLRVPALPDGMKERPSGAEGGDVEIWFPKLNAHAPIPAIALKREEGSVLIQKTEEQSQAITTKRGNNNGKGTDTKSPKAVKEDKEERSNVKREKRPRLAEF